MPLPNDIRERLHWLSNRGVTDLNDLNPCIPGQFTLADAYYVNTATPELIYLGTEEGTLPMTAGRWYLIPETILARAPALTENPTPVARAARLARS